MIKYSKRITALFIAVLLLLASLTACASQTKQEQTPIGSCQGYEVLYEELRYLTLSYKDILEERYGEGIWDDPATAEQHRAELESTVWDLLRNNYAVLATVEKYLPEASLEDEEIVEAVDDYIETLLTQYASKDAYRLALQENYTTEHLMRFTIGVSELENKLLNYLTLDQKLIEHDTNAFADWLRDGNCVYVQHLYIANDAGDDPAANRAIAEEVQSRLIKGESIDTFVGDKTYNEDPENAAPYFLIRDVHEEEMESAALSLTADGQVSRIVETEDGFYIFQRLSYDDAKLTEQLSDLLVSWQWATLEAMVEELKEELSIELNDYGKSIDLLTIR